LVITNATPAALSAAPLQDRVVDLVTHIALPWREVVVVGPDHHVLVCELATPRDDADDVRAKVVLLEKAEAAVPVGHRWCGHFGEQRHHQVSWCCRPLRLVVASIEFVRCQQRNHFHRVGDRIWVGDR
jgi:hypothetical protein